MMWGREGGGKTPLTRFTAREERSRRETRHYKLTTEFSCWLMLMLVLWTDVTHSQGIVFDVNGSL